LTDLLREELGFKGIAVTDWEDIIKLYRDHRVAKEMREAVKIAVMAGIDMSMTPNDYSFNRALVDLVQSGEIPESRLDESCRRILWVKKQLGILKNPLPDKDYPLFGSKEHKDWARKTAEESITLLKNQNDILPLAKKANLLVCGPAANSLNVLNGAWTHTWQGVDTNYNTQGCPTILQSIRSQSYGKVEYALGSGLNVKADIEEAVRKAGSADAIVVCLGEKPSTEKPGDLEDLSLPLAQQQLVQALYLTGKPLIFVFVFNRPLLVREIEPLSSAIVHAYLPGDWGGEAVARILFGEVNPSGKLPFTYPRYSGSFVPYDHKYTEKLDTQFGQNAFNPQWPFGFGLSYSRFEYSGLKLDKAVYGMEDTIEVSLTVRNSSNLSGQEVVQLYIGDLVASITPSVKRLRDFEKVTVGPQENVELTMEIPVRELAFVGSDLQWRVEAGSFRLEVGKESIIFEVE